MSEPTALGLSLRTGGILLVFTVIFTALMAATYRATKDNIAASIEAEKLSLIGEVLPGDIYDNRLLDDYLTMPPAPGREREAPTRVYRARKSGAPAAVVLEAVAPDGYSGDIGLLIAIGFEGRVLGVRVTRHRETPGLGDYIDIHKDRNKSRPWITQFSGLGFDTVAAAQWKVKKDGGRFDYVTGATISARAVTRAVARAVDFCAENRERLFSAPAQSQF